MPGGTNFPVLPGLGCGSQTPYPYDAYPHRRGKTQVGSDSVTMSPASVICSGDRRWNDRIRSLA